MSIQLPRISLNYRPRPRTIGLGAVSLLALWCATNSMIWVPQNEVAFVTRFGKVTRPEAGPLLPGLHFKVPLIDHADLLSVSTDTVRFGAIRAFTRDTQEVSLQLSATFRIPPAAAFHLLYEVGRSGNVDIAHNLEAVANDRVRSVVSRRDVTEIAGEGRERIVDEIKALIASELNRLFRVEVQDVQIPQLDFSTQYKDAVNRATLARAQRVQAEQDRERSRVEAETVIVRARGEADSQVARADGEARARIAQARADAEAVRLKGDAEAAAIKVKIDASGGIDGFIRHTQAQAALNWKGQVPQVSGGSGNQIPIVLPIKLDEGK